MTSLTPTTAVSRPLERMCTFFESSATPSPWMELPLASRWLSFHTASQLPTSDQPMSAGTTAARLVRSITA